MRPVVISAVTAALLASGYWLVVGGDPVDDAADQLAMGLSNFSLDDVAMTSAADRDRFDAVVAAVSDTPVKVTVTDVDETDGTATVALAWTWDFGEESWQYSTEAVLEDAAGRWELAWDPTLVAPGLDAGDVLDIDRLTGDRGRILGIGGAPLVTKRPVTRYGLDKSTVASKKWRSSAVRIARALAVDVRSYRKKVQAYGNQAFVEAIVLRDADARELVPASYDGIPGAVAIPDEIPLAPTRSFAAPILGSTGPATAEIVEKSDGAISAGDEVGLSGLQARYDDTLRARAGVRVQAVSSDGQSRDLFRMGIEPGRDLRTTLDPELQIKAERVLADHVAADGPDSALVAIRPSTGEILAAANGPANEGFNAATAGRYAPGSTFKIVTALALLRSGLSPRDTVHCDTTTRVDGRSFKNYDDYPATQIGRITLRRAIAHSCNTALIASRDRLKPDTLRNAAAALGLGVDHDLGFSAYFGQAPTPEGETEKAADMIGQGKILASPMAMALVAASVQAGHAVVPVLLPDHAADHSAPLAPLTRAEAVQLRGLMRAVVTEGSGGFLADLPSQVGAKTGTAEYGQPDDNGNLATHTWMIATQDDVAVSVFVETGASGSATAGPILEDFLR